MIFDPVWLAFRGSAVSLSLLGFRIKPLFRGNIDALGHKLLNREAGIPDRTVLGRGLGELIRRVDSRLVNLTGTPSRNKA